MRRASSELACAPAAARSPSAARAAATAAAHRALHRRGPAGVGPRAGEVEAADAACARRAAGARVPGATRNVARGSRVTAKSSTVGAARGREQALERRQVALAQRRDGLADLVVGVRERDGDELALARRPTTSVRSKTPLHGRAERRPRTARRARAGRSGRAGSRSGSCRAPASASASTAPGGTSVGDRLVRDRDDRPRPPRRRRRRAASRRSGVDRARPACRATIRAARALERRRRRVAVQPLRAARVGTPMSHASARRAGRCGRPSPPRASDASSAGRFSVGSAIRFQSAVDRGGGLAVRAQPVAEGLLVERRVVGVEPAQRERRADRRERARAAPSGA